MAATVATIAGTLRELRIIHGTLLVAAFLYAYIVFEIPAPTTPLDPVFFLSMTALAITMAFLAFWMRSKLLGAAFEKLRMQADDRVALANWRKGVVVGDVLAESVVLCGFAIHFLGATNIEVIPFLIGGTALIILWWPRLP